MQLCFLTNNDITGGNSGSPMFNGKGELIGLAFDGNWDSLSSDINFDRNLARCIGVDIRFVLFMMDKWGHADRLIKESTLSKATSKDLYKIKGVAEILSCHTFYYSCS